MGVRVTAEKAINC